MLLPTGVCVSVTIKFAAYVTLQTPEVTPSSTVHAIPAGMLVIVPLPRDASDDVTVSVAGGASVNVTPIVAVAALVTTTLHGADVHAPEKPDTVPLAALNAFNATVLPAANDALQVPLGVPAVIVHAIPSGTLVIVPDPEPDPLTATLPGGTTVRYVRSTFRCDVMAMLQEFPTHVVLQPTNSAPRMASCDKVTTVPGANRAEHAPTPAPGVTVQSMPAGADVTRPLPFPLPATLRATTSATGSTGVPLPFLEQAESAATARTAVRSCRVTA
jgi:hypothetical protein